MSTPDRAACISAWRALFGILEGHPDLPLPGAGTPDIPLRLHALGAGPRAARAAVAAFETAMPAPVTAAVTGISGDPCPDGLYYALTGTVNGLTVTLLAYARDVAERRVTGTRTIEDVEWVRIPPEPEGETA